MANKSYYEIRECAKLTEYHMMFAGKNPIWIETYKNDGVTYRAVFSPESTSHLPSTIIQTNDLS